MADPSNRPEFQRRYRTNQYTSADGANTVGIDEDVVDEGQVTEIRISGNEQVDYTLTIEETDTGNVSTQITLAGSSDYNVGNFAEPVVEFGAESTVKVENLDDITAINGVTVVIDERTG